MKNKYDEKNGIKQGKEFMKLRKSVITSTILVACMIW